MPIRLGELARQFDCKLLGDAEVQIASVASLGSAGPDALSFLSGAAFKQQLATTRAAAVIVRAADAKDCPTASLVHENPYACYARIADFLYPPPAIEPGIHRSAELAASARISPSAQISAHVCIGERSIIGDHTYIAPGCIIGDDCRIGSNGRMLANVTVVSRVTIGNRFILHPGVVIGSDGFGNAMTPQGWVKVPQLGGVRVGDDVEVGANSAIDLGALEDTVIGDGVRIDNLVHVAHNVKIGAHTAIAGQCGFSGSVTIGQRCMFGGQSGVAGHLTICDDVIVNGKGLITKSITQPGVYSSAFPSEPVNEWNRIVARIRRLGNLIERISKLEKRES
ncbi:MAG: UDP-3-O-(3-hydroxymyristoyl)glucosamine N-acyltransferase [Gammaproteobacteria bacterium]|nr:UDP-3-O-(3-hydroxymyristoyl)glucosamine N-acyltransferase [Gammaproteobacteria bacterium]MDH5303341.1 UDP-3-O-(3-hydroxymyristoyl)glucosamine N-acyltransferase [Gammaproteobacteria bacterium]MDH5322465.1 UDP-3-O-(3-hydroxymyristoyl)glucosamine N-acyltransferase [Gammaproteobacteria bacterium]